MSWAHQPIGGGELTRMGLDFVDDVLRRLATESGYAPNGWTPDEIADYRLLVQCAGAGSLDDLRSLGIFRLSEWPGLGPDCAVAVVGATRTIGLAYDDGHSAGVTFVTFDRRSGCLPVSSQR